MAGSHPHSPARARLRVALAAPVVRSRRLSQARARLPVAPAARAAGNHPPSMVRADRRRPHRRRAVRAVGSRLPSRARGSAARAVGSPPPSLVRAPAGRAVGSPLRSRARALQAVGSRSRVKAYHRPRRLPPTVRRTSLIQAARSTPAGLPTARRRLTRQRVALWPRLPATTVRSGR